MLNSDTEEIKLTVYIKPIDLLDIIILICYNPHSFK